MAAFFLSFARFCPKSPILSPRNKKVERKTQCHSNFNSTKYIHKQKGIDKSNKSPISKNKNRTDLQIRKKNLSRIT
jgi:hypothetical protein